MSSVWLTDTPKVVRKLSNEENKAVRFDRYSPESIVYAGCILRQRKLPQNIVNTILHLASHWVEFYEETNQDVVYNSPLDHEYLRLVVPDYLGDEGLILSRCVGLSIECNSHDQGYSSESHSCPYDGCWSWIEFEIIDAVGIPLLPRNDVCYNVRGSPDFRHHLTLYEDRTILDLLQTPTNQLVVYLRAEYSGWQIVLTMHEFL